MPPSDSQAFLREPFIRSDDTPVVSRTRMAAGVPKLAGLAPAIDSGVEREAGKPSGDAGLIDLIATIPFQHTLRNLSRHSAATTDLAPNGSMALLLVNGSMSSNSIGEGDIRPALIEGDLLRFAGKN